MHDTRRIATLHIREETDVVACRQSAKRIAGWLELPQLEQIRFATAVSELARNVFQYAGQGTFHFDLAENAAGQLAGLCFEAVDQGPGIAAIERILDGSYVSPTGMGIGLRGAQRLMDDFDIETSTRGTRIRARKLIHPPRPFPTPSRIGAIRDQLQDEGAADPYIELQVRGTELMLTAAELQTKQQELEATNQELENTNKGVVALYSELEKATEEVREASESKSRFFANMTHEIRTPINIVENISKLLLKGIDGPLNPEQYKQVSFISDAASELSDLVNELLDISEAESGRIEITPVRFTLGDFVEQLRQFVGALSQRFPALDWEVAGAPHDVELETDRHRLFQIMRNLIGNAFKYTPSGRVCVRAYLPDEDSVEFLVEDTGIGIAPENHARVFEEFLRVRNPSRTQIQGTGLGLPLARRLAALLHGEISLNSELGQGSRFLLRVDRRHGSVDGEPATLDLEGINILLIDDSEADRYLLSRLLQPYHPVIIEAVTAASSIDKLHAIRPDIIFLDLDLPDIAGEDLLESMDWSMHARVLVNTAKALDDTMLERLGRQCRAILHKSRPDYPEQVLHHVRRLAEEQRDAY
ncbi:MULTISPECIES: ATP-binding protein [unclassified Pseudomonas]|uniref:ATP-binding protein n=1 Tax=unclassified Pseudomonas TaxID=196821 RepID=UPI00244BA4BD|nr:MULTISPECIES: ATP-binding protein [unclassified Pseudomonas]MDH0897452.1 ATP-binding protein [Pseudomonas sp. GD03875]MDH1067605.1 ATP-binding protein [Pseudomonas sp. GD03985]